MDEEDPLVQRSGTVLSCCCCRAVPTIHTGLILGLRFARSALIPAGLRWTRAGTPPRRPTADRGLTRAWPLARGPERVQNRGLLAARLVRRNVLVGRGRRCRGPAGLLGRLCLRLIGGPSGGC